MLHTKGLSARHDAESRAAEGLLPAPLHQARPLARGPVRALKVRIWADPSYRRTAFWREHLQRVLGRVNDYLRESLAVELDAEIKPWETEVDASNLDAFLSELERHDPGDGVDHVIGMTGALPVLSSSHEQLGRAWTPGKHLVLRAMTDALERQELASALPTLDKKELDELFKARSAHKEDAILVHEWAHNYGALHDEGRGSLMSPGYSTEASGFSDANLQLLALSIAARQGDAAAREALIKHVASAQASWDPRERQMLVQALASGERMPEVPPANERGASPEPAFDDAVRHAGEQRAAGRLDEAWRELEALRARAGQPWQHGRLAEVYLELGAYTRSLEELDGAVGMKGVDDVRANLVLMRRQRGVYGVAPAEEPAANAAVEAAHLAFAAGEKAKVKKLVADGLARWANLSGLLALRCASELEADKLRAAAATCKRAVAAGDDSVMAHYFSGHAAARSGQRAAAAASFARAMALDPDAAVAYEALARVYEEEGQKDKLDELRRRYLQRFKRSLPMP